MSKEIIVVTGCLGLIGSNFCHWLLENTEHDVIGIDNLSGGSIHNSPELSDRFVLFQEDICHRKEIDKIFEICKPTIVYHFAAYAAECVSVFIRCFNYTNNVVGSASIINACIKYNVKRLVFTSSMAVYGNAEPPFDEKLTPNPIDSYGIAKYAVEMDIKCAGEQHGLDWCIIRPHNVYGKFQALHDPYRNFIGIAMYKALVGDPITVYGDGKQTRAFSEINDCLLPLYKAGTIPEASKQIINLGGTREFAIRDVAEMVADLSGAKIIYLPPRHEVKHAYATWEKSVDILDYEHKTKLTTGINNMWQWAKKLKLEPRFIWDEYEVEVGIYEYWNKEKLKDGYYKK